MENGDREGIELKITLAERESHNSVCYCSLMYTKGTSINQITFKVARHYHVWLTTVRPEQVNL